MNDCPNLKIVNIKFNRNYVLEASVEIKSNSSIEILEIQQGSSLKSWKIVFDTVQKCQNLKNLTLTDFYDARELPQNTIPITILKYLSIKLEYAEASHWRQIMTIFPKLTVLEIKVGIIFYRNLSFGFGLYISLLNYNIFEIFNEGFYELKKLRLMESHPHYHRNFWYCGWSLIRMIRTHPNLKYVEIPRTRATENELEVLMESLVSFKSEAIELEI
jgi:hypothetical protein